METNTLLVTDDTGREFEMTILFTFHDDKGNKDYVVYYDDKDDSGQLFAASYNEAGELFPVGEDEEELDMINEVIGSFLDEKPAEEKTA